MLTPQTFSIRPALESEIESICQLWLKLDASKKQQPFGGDLQDEVKQRTENLVTHSITSETAISLVAETEDGLVGTLSAYIYEKPAVALPKIAVLYSLWVEPEHRRHGIASALLQAAETQLKTMGAQCLQVAWDSDNPTAAAFWQREQFTAYEVIASKTLK
ncbi:GNAT family N-acetyltransferase [Pontibacterium sp.]|uniref:GNAT family N-acetyltransferase n=1 Tax=Pontibacterium sp. TaxID=2036026 RepID=UPI0035655F30